MNMTEDQRNAYFERKRKENIERALGPGTPYPIPDPITTRITVDPNGKSIYDEVRVHYDKDLPCFDPWLREYNEMRLKNGGKIVTYIEEPLDSEVPPPVK